jgi:hypothetical protein
MNDRNPCKITITKATEDDMTILSKMIKMSYQDVAKTFNLTKENCPKDAIIIL